MRAKSKSGNDFLQLGSTDIGGRSIVKMGTGDDATVWAGDNTVSRANVTLGGPGADQLQIDIGNNFLGPNVNRSFLSDSLSDGLAEDRLSNPVSGALVKSTTAQAIFRSEDGPTDEGTEDEDDTGGNGENGPLELAVDFTPSVVNQVNDTLVINDSLFVIEGTATEGATVELAVGADNLFDDGSIVVGEDGEFQFTLRLEGQQEIIDLQVRATDEQGTELIETASVFFAVEQSVVLETSLGNIEIELLAEDAPLTVRNFLDYLEQDNELIVHRAPNNFVVQTGSFAFANGTVQDVATSPSIENEFDPGNSNLRGTVSMALLSGQPNSGTSGWFINTVDNPSLDGDLHTVFGRVSDASLAIVDEINDLPIFDLRALIGESAFRETPLRDYEQFSSQIAGTVSAIQDSATVSGSGTAFLSEIPPDNMILINGQEFEIASVESDTSLTLTTTPTFTFAGVAAVNGIPDDSNYIIVRSQF